jgi:hypothetical protein
MRKLLYRVVETKVFRDLTGFRWEAYLLIAGQGKPVKGQIASMEDLEASMVKAIEQAYLDVTGSPLPDTAH